MAGSSAKQIVVKPISAKDANAVIKKLHYSGKVVPNSQLHFGIFLNGRCGGVMQFGPSLTKKGMINLVADTEWNGFIELNRMAFADWLPRNSESRALGFAMRYLRKNYPHIKWVISFADGTQCGDGTIYRASGFVLTDVRPNRSLRRNPATGEVMHDMQAHHLMMRKEFNTWPVLEGFQLRYVYFLDESYRSKLTVPVLPFSTIAEMGATMYRGSRVVSIDSDAASLHDAKGGASPTTTLHQPSEA